MSGEPFRVFVRHVHANGAVAAGRFLIAGPEVRVETKRGKEDRTGRLPYSRIKPILDLALEEEVPVLPLPGEEGAGDSWELFMEGEARSASYRWKGAPPKGWERLGQAGEQLLAVAMDATGEYL